MANSTFSIPVVFQGATAAQADQRRDDALRDYAIFRELDIYTDQTRTVIDPAKVAPAVRADIRARLIEGVKYYRQITASRVALVAAGTQADQELS